MKKIERNIYIFISHKLIVVGSMNQEINQDQVKELIKKAENNKEERFFILNVEEITDYTNKNWFERHISVLYGEIRKIILNEIEENKGNIIRRYIAVIPETPEAVIMVQEESDNLNWRQTYFYVFLSSKGWTLVQ